MTGNMILTDSTCRLYYNKKNSPVSLASVILPYGYKSKELKRGYAHLIEHMIIRCNMDYFNQLESRGIIYNAETQAEKTLFTFLDFDGKVLDNEVEHLGKLLECEFGQNALDIEKKTIAQEHLYRASMYSIKSVNEAIGTPEEINQFSLESLIEARKAMMKSHKVLYISPSTKRFKNVLKVCANQELTDDWYKNISIENISEDENSINIILKNDIYSELLAYSLNILCMCSFEHGKIEHYKNGDRIMIILHFNRDKFLSMIKDKSKSFSRYIIYLDTIKVYYQELADCINNIGLDFDAEKCYMSRWEVRLLEKL